MDNQSQSTPNQPTERDIVLRCNRCNKPITPETAVLTPTGYRCKECVREQQKVFDTSKRIDVPLGFILSGLMAFAGSWLVPRLGFITLLVAPGMGMLIANVVRWAVKKRRSKTLNKAVLWGVVVGCLPLLVMQIIPMFFAIGGVLPAIGNLLPLVWQVVYSVLTVSTAYYQFTGIRLS
ncbi:MAG: hypothetical protein WA110_01910 [Anaerolineaceae bacterium]